MLSTRRFLLARAWLPVCLVMLTTTARAGELDDLKQRESTAVALNYCRAAFHRITRAPAKPVLLEEQEKILNNLNLSAISDEEVVRLYSELLQEIGEVQVADQERQVIRERYRATIQRQAAVNAFTLGTELATAQYISAVRTGARSWWDYRTTADQREFDAWRIDKERMLRLTDKSSRFLDTFWKLASKRSIPDRWLVRNADLDQLEVAVAEPDAEVRLRVLRRMQPFMEYYPPYWYYVGRTQQALGQLFAASQTYAKLAERGGNNFRKDEMLAAGLANRAMIQEHLQQAGSVTTAQEALRCATDVWEVNLVCAYVLSRHQQYDDAEDAILRNLDVELEQRESLTGLLTLYCEADRPQKLVRRLSDANVVRTVSLPLLLRCAACLGNERVPQVAADYITASLTGRFDLNFGRDSLVFAAHPHWELERARVTLRIGDREHHPASRMASKEAMSITFRKILEMGSPLAAAGDTTPVMLVLQYPELPEIQLHLDRQTESTLPVLGNVSLTRDIENGPWSGLAMRRQVLLIKSMAFGDSRLALLPDAKQPDRSPLPHANADPVNEPPLGEEQADAASVAASEPAPAADAVGSPETAPAPASAGPTPPAERSLEPVPVTPPAGTEIR